MVKEYHTPFIANSTLSDRERAYCSCILSVAMKESDECLKSKGKGPGCKIPYAICNDKFHLGGVECSSDYKYQDFTPERLRAYILLHGVPTSADVNNMSQQDLVNAIYSWKGTIGHK